MPLEDLFDRKPWPNQIYAVEKGIDAVSKNLQTCITSPTGSGKTAIMIGMIRWCAATGRRVILYTNRIMLTEQTAKSLDDHNVSYGTIARGSKGEDRFKPVQLARAQTVHARAVRKNTEALWRADVVLVDEAHQMAQGMYENIIRLHQQSGSTALGITATPLGVSHLYNNLTIAGTTRQCMAHGALVPASIKAPSEVDYSKLVLGNNGEFSLPAIRKATNTNVLVGHVYDGWKRHNPFQRPALGFAPGVQESKWYSDHFRERGVSSAHIDGTDVRIDGKDYKSDQSLRDEIVARWRDGEIKVIWNRFVLREGIDFPWMYHLILACPIGSLNGYIQTCGRVLRYSDETPDHVVITDHAGNYWRHGYSPNDNIDWEQFYYDDPSIPTRKHLDDLSTGDGDEDDPTSKEPYVCPKCHSVLRSRQCPPPPFGCGHYVQGYVRRVIQQTGKLVEVSRPAVRRRVVRQEDDTYKLWRDMFWRMKKAGKTLAQAEGFFFYNYHYYPPSDMPFMPHRPIDKFRQIDEIDKKLLIDTHEHRQIREAKGEEPAT